MYIVVLLGASMIVSSPDSDNTRSQLCSAAMPGWQALIWPVSSLHCCAWPTQCPQFHSKIDAPVLLPSCLCHYAKPSYDAVLALCSSCQKNWSHAGFG